ncbi:prepilin-type N-terminal cleavage/methylation domain-containing protein [Aeromonas sp. XH]|uniref:prepilin-type N-terminal cleavage/methylation domain-containing protein n=1 Tax=Aeromonas sp. XH TaxID=3081770 RepID=UPI002966E7D2|nr:prepilin-type N-terminal cleavage/methylation domain-containing protein [Aeromonas sp. XH]WOX47844.1 prepilin-type N-terminal cleavage/methylation domain-containing protein [Aeromonas sp. XH]
MKRQKGFGLFEILVTLVVLGVGVVGLVILSKSALTASQDGKRYEVAMRLAESKIEEFRNFNSLVTATAPLTAYASITSGNATKSQSGDSYTLAWTVTNQYWNGSTSAWQNTAPAGYLLNYPGRKQINTTVSWTNSEGATASVALIGYASPTESLTAEQLNGGLDTARTGPKISYNPGVAPDVISIDLGNGSRQETSKPSPTVVAKNNTVGKEVQFETVTYQPGNQGNTQQIQQDISSVSCACTYGSTLNAYLPGQAYSTATNQLYWKVGVLQSKQTGTVGNNQPALCTSCCKDHFDGSGGSFTSYYAPLNTSRQRYNSSLSLASSGSYIDACRFARLDGYYRPLPDWNLVKVIVTTSDFLAKPANQVSYQNYIQYVVKTYIDWQKQTLNWTSSTTATAPTISEFEAWLQTPANVAAGGDASTGITVSTGTRQLIARGIYVDILNPAYLTGIDTSVTGYLAKVPFQDINLTMLAEWSMTPLSGQLTGAVTDYATISNEPVDTIVDLNNYYFGSYSRGYLATKKSTKDASQNLQAVKVKATVYQGNSGITATLISPQDQSQALSTELAVKIDSGTVTQPLLTVTGKVQCLEKTKNNDPTPIACKKNVFNNLSMNTSTSGATCQIDKPSSDNQTAIYTCTAAQNSTLVVNFSYSGNTTFLLKPSSLSIPMTPPASGQVISGPCTLLADNGVTNAANLTCSP